jgi:hypothetical protein
MQFFFNTGHSSNFRNVDMSFEEFVTYLRNCYDVSEIAGSVDINTVETFGQGKIIGNKRRTKNIAYISMVVLDFDNFEGSLEKFKKDLFSLRNYTYYVYTTKRHDISKPRLRVVLPLREEISVDYSKDLIKKFLEESLTDGFKKAIDVSATINPAQVFYTPFKSNDDYVFWEDYNKTMTNLDLNVYLNQVDLNKKQKAVFSKKPMNLTKEEILEDLEFLNEPRCYERDMWLRVGMCLHHQFQGSGEGFDIFDDWSKKDTDPSRYKGKYDVCKTWESFRNEQENPVTWASIRKTVDLIKKSKDLSDLDILEPTKVDKFEFPDKEVYYTQGRNGEFKEKVEILPTYKNFIFLIEKHNIKIVYDVITKKSYVNKLGNHLDGGYIGSIISILAINKFPKQNLESYLQKAFCDNKINSFKDFVLSKEWDGVDRIEQLCRTVTVEKKFEKLKKNYLSHWLSELIKMSCFNDDIRNPKFTRAVLLFFGKQGMGKTTWFRNLMPKDLQYCFFLEGLMLNLQDRMSILKSLSYVVCELGEIEASFKKSDVVALKNFISSTKDSIDRKYSRDFESHNRTTVFCASTNDPVVLNDHTGNDRYLLLPVEKLVLDHQIDMQQLYAQLYNRYLTQGPVFLSEEDCQQQKEINLFFSPESDIDCLFAEKFHIESNDRSEKMNCTEILKFLDPNVTHQSRLKQSEIKLYCIKAGYVYCSKMKKFKLPPKKSNFDFDTL